MQKKCKMKTKLFSVLLVIGITMIFVGIFFYNRMSISNRIKRIAEENGMQNVSVDFRGKVPDYGFQEVAIKSSNLDTLSKDTMYKIVASVNDGDVFVDTFLCNGDTYKVYPETRSIYKNGDIIDDDYRNSDSYKSVKEDNKKPSSSNSSKGEHGATNQDNDSSVSDDEKGTCWALAKDVVKQNLKSPSSAKFPFSYVSEGVSITKSGNTYTVQAWVDAENSFGANLRSNFTVTMEKRGSGKNTKFTSKSCIID